MDQQISEIIEFIKEISDEGNLPRNVRSKFSEIVALLKMITKDNLSLTVNKLLSDLDEVATDTNLDQFTRQQIWSISSMLESINA